MSPVPQPTPNPNAMKFTVGVDMRGPRSYTAANAGDDPVACQLMAVSGVVAVFMTADFVTVTKQEDADWSVISPSVGEILEACYRV